MNTATHTITLDEGYFSRRTWFDWLFALVVAIGGAYALVRYGSFMDGYEKAILLGCVPAAVWVGWFWQPLRLLMLVVASVSVLASVSYQGSLSAPRRSSG